MADLSPREELLALQKRIFAKNDDFIRSQTAVRERGFEEYEGHYKRAVCDYQKASSIEELVEAILEADLIFVGDYHTNKQSQRTLLRLLKLVVEREPALAIGLEIFRKGDLAEYGYPELWQNFEPIFDFARFHKVPLFRIEKPLGSDTTLTERDRESAGTIARFLKKNPERKLFLFVGDLHIAPPHLPREVERALRPLGLSKKMLILYQNSESIYWRLAERELEEKVEIVRVDERSFCIINTPPIVQQQSYVNWLEHEEGAIDFADAKASFLELIRQIAVFLEIPLPPAAEEVEVYTCGDLSFLKKLAESDLPAGEIRQIKRQILASESYCIPGKGLVYLANVSLHHAAEEAAHYLKYLCSGPEFLRDPVDAFYANTIHEALGFFGSKIVNHKRKCFHEKEYRGLVNYLHSSKARGREMELEIALLILKHKDLEKKGVSIRSQRYFKARRDLFFGVTHGLGYMLGDRLYYSLLAERVTKEELQELFRDPMKEESEPFQLYKKFLKKVRGVKIPRRV